MYLHVCRIHQQRWCDVMFVLTCWTKNGFWFNCAHSTCTHSVIHVHTVSYMYMYTQCHTYILPASTVDCSRQTPPHSTTDVQLGRHLAGDLVQHYSKCFLCNNCADSGVGCAFNKLNGKTSRYVWLVITRYAPCCSCTSYSFWKFD